MQTFGAPRRAKTQNLACTFSQSLPSLGIPIELSSGGPRSRRSPLRITDIFRNHGAAWRRANAWHVSLNHLKVMSAIERCRTVAHGGHVARCEDCAR